MELTQPIDWLEKPCIGYVMNAGFSEQNATKIQGLMDVIEKELGDAVFCMPQKSLHMTLLDWIAPLVDYDGRDKDELFAELRASYDSVINKAVSSETAFSITFDEIYVSPNTIIIIGHDGGQFQRIRDSFVANVTLLPGAKMPPDIIHSSLARFRKPIPMDRVREVLSNMDVDITQDIDSFRLVNTRKEPMLEFDVLKEYKLKDGRVS